MLNKITVREWIKNFNSGEYDNPSKEVQWKAKWADYFCDINELSLRLRKIGYIISGITNDILLDYYTLKLYNRCALLSPEESVLYDSIMFEPIDKNMFPNNYTFYLSIERPKEECLFDVSASWRDYDSEFSCNDLNTLYASLDIMMNNLYKRPMLIYNK